MRREPLLRAYRATRYVAVDGAREVVATVEQPSTALDDLLRRHHVDVAAFVTAWNPRSILQPPALNDMAHGRLTAELDAAGVRWLPHRGEGPDPAWAAEHGVLALGLDESSAINFALRYGQYAVVMVEAGGAPRLVLTALIDCRS